MQLGIYLICVVVGIILYSAFQRFEFFVTYDGEEISKISSWLVLLFPTFLFFVLLLLSLVRTTTRYRKIASGYYANKNEKVKLGSKGLSFENEDGILTVNYNAVDLVDNFDGGLILKFGLLCHFIPKRAFLSDQLRHKLLVHLRASMRHEAANTSPALMATT